MPGYFPDWVTRVLVKKQDGEVLHAVCDKPATLVYLVMGRHRHGLGPLRERLQEVADRSPQG